MSDAVLFDPRDDAIAIITLNRPETRNALSREIRAGLFQAWDRFERDPALRIAILTGAGEKAFCAGGDLKEMVDTGMKVPPRDMFPLPYDTIELSKPTIAAVNGVAFGGGWVIAQACLPAFKANEPYLKGSYSGRIEFQASLRSPSR